MLNTHLRAEVFNLGTAVKAYYLVHGGSLEKMPLEAQNLCVSIDYCLSDTPESDEVSEAALAGLLSVGITIIADSPAAASVSVGAALYRAREVLWQRKLRAAQDLAPRLSLREALTRSHTVAYLAADGVRYEVQEGVNFCMRRFAPDELPDAFAAISLAAALQIAAGRGWPSDAASLGWIPVHHAQKEAAGTR